MVASPSDIELLERIRRDDIQAFDELYYHYWKVMYHAAVGRLKSTDLAQDIVQDIFIDFWNRRKTIEIKSGMKVYLLTAVKYKVFRLVDRMHRHESLDDIHTDLLSTNDTILEFEEVYKLIEVSLEKLKPVHCAIFKMNKFDGMPVREISNKVNMAPQSVHNVLSKTTKYLKEELKGYYFF